MIVALLGGHVLLLSSMVYVATSDSSFAVEPDYYQKGLNWDTTADQLHQNRQLGWSVRISVAREGTYLGERSLTCTLKDRDGRPIEGAIVDLVAFPHVRGNQRISTNLREVGQGQYAGALRFHPSGLWEFRFAVRQGDETFTHVMQRNVASIRRD